MKTTFSRLIRSAAYSTILVAACVPGFAQEPREGEPMPQPEAQDQSRQAPALPPATPGGWRRFDEAGPGQPPPSAQYAPPQASYRQDVPSVLTIPAGTFVTVRVNQPLSSNRNQPGDAFSATLSRPLVVNGVVVAQRGQTVAGRVTEAQKGGRIKGTSRLGIQLTELSLVDGMQVPIDSQLVTRDGGTSVGRDVGVVATTTAVGAAIGASADWGRGAAIGAGAGAAAGIVGVLLTRGEPAVVHPEMLLTFRIERPIQVSTERAPQAFRYIEAGDYERAADTQLHSRPAPQPHIAYYGPSYSPYYDPYYSWYGPGFYYGYGGGYGFGGGHYRGGYRYRGRR